MKRFSNKIGATVVVGRFRPQVIQAFQANVHNIIFINLIYTRYDAHRYRFQI